MGNSGTMTVTFNDTPRSWSYSGSWVNPNGEIAFPKGADTLHVTLGTSSTSGYYICGLVIADTQDDLEQLKVDFKLSSPFATTNAAVFSASPLGPWTKDSQISLSDTNKTPATYCYSIAITDSSSETSVVWSDPKIINPGGGDPPHPPHAGRSPLSGQH